MAANDIAKMACKCGVVRFAAVGEKGASAVFLEGRRLLDRGAGRLLLYKSVFRVFEAFGVSSCRLVAQG